MASINNSGNPVGVLTELLARLRLGSDRISNLNELRDLLSAVTLADVEQQSQSLSLSSLFDCLHSKNEEEVELCCDILPKLLSSISNDVVLTQCNSELIRGLQHESAKVREITVQQICRCTTEDPKSLLNVGEDMVLALVNSIQDVELGISRSVCKVLTSLAESSVRNLLFTSSVQSQIKKVKNCNDVVRFRVYELIVAICKQSDENLEKCLSQGLLSPLMEEMKSDDILLQLNCLQLLSDLAEADQGLNYLESCGLVTKIESLLKDTNNPLIRFLLPGIFKFYGTIGHKYPKKILDDYQGFTEELFQSVKCDDQMVKGIGIETIGIIGMTPSGKLALNKLGKMEECMKELGETMIGSIKETRIKALETTELLLSLEVSEQTFELSSIVESWFDHLGAKPFDLILGICRQPFRDLRCSSLSILKALASQPWGQKRFVDYPGFIEYLLDRSTEPDKEGKDSKFEVIKILNDSPTSRGIMGDSCMEKVSQYAKEGPYHIRIQSEVALEEGQ